MAGIPINKGDEPIGNITIIDHEISYDGTDSYIREVVFALNRAGGMPMMGLGEGDEFGLAPDRIKYIPFSLDNLAYIENYLDYPYSISEQG